jgi:hypothetical protein
MLFAPEAQYLDQDQKGVCPHLPLFNCAHRAAQQFQSGNWFYAQAEATIV